MTEYRQEAINEANRIDEEIKKILCHTNFKDGDFNDTIRKNIS